MAETIQGKCTNCRLRFVWPRRGHRPYYPTKLKNAKCPFCGTKLKKTTYLLQWKTSDVIPTGTEL